MAPDQAALVVTNAARIRERIALAAGRAGCRADEITLVAVTKTFPAEAIRAAHAAGLRHFGENRLQEYEGKMGHLADLQGTWHFIGHLQSNKARRTAQLFDRIDSVDSLGLAQKLNEAAAAAGKRLGVLIEVHLGGEETKSGIAESELAALAESMTALPHLELLGLMTIPPYFDDPEEARPHFARLRDLRDQTSGRVGRPLPVLSMGMSHDFEVAIAEGATEVRVGTALFSERHK